MKKSLSLLVTLALTVCLAGCGSASLSKEVQNNSALADTGGKVLQIGIIEYTAQSSLDAACEGFVADLRAKGYVDGQNIKFEILNAQGDENNLKTIAQKFAAQKKDLIFAISAPAAKAAAAQTSEIPIVFTAVTNPISLGLVKDAAAPSGNITGTTDKYPAAAQIDLLKKLVPNAEKIAVLYCSGEQSSAAQAQAVIEAAKAQGITAEARTIVSENDVNQVVEALTGSYSAIVIPADNTLSSAMDKVSKIANAAKTPVIVSTKNMVQAGGLAAATVNYTDLGKQSGEQAVKLLSGTEVKSVPVEAAASSEIIINKAVAEEIEVEISDDVAANATILQSEQSTQAASGTEQ